MQLRVRYRLTSIDLDLPDVLTIAALQGAVEQATEVPPARQKLVAKGKILVADADLRLVRKGTTVMVLEQAATGTYSSRGTSSSSESRGQAFQNALLRTKAAIKKAVTPQVVLKAKEIEERVAAGAKLGYVALNGVPVGDIPSSAFERNLSRIELVNCSFHHNDCQRLFLSPALESLKKLKLNNCQLEDEHMVFQAIGGLRSLAHLELRGNRIKHIAGLRQLDQPMKVLDLSNNPLTSCGEDVLAVEQLVVSRCGLKRLDLHVLAQCEVWIAMACTRRLADSLTDLLALSLSGSLAHWITGSLARSRRWSLRLTTISAPSCRRRRHDCKCWICGIMWISRSFPTASLSISSGYGSSSWATPRSTSLISGHCRAGPSLKPAPNRRGTNVFLS